MSGAFSRAELAEVSTSLGEASAAELLAWVERRFGARAALASSFGVEDVVLIDLAAKHAPQPARVHPRHGPATPRDLRADGGASASGMG